MGPATEKVLPRMRDKSISPQTAPQSLTPASWEWVTLGPKHLYTGNSEGQGRDHRDREAMRKGGHWKGGAPGVRKMKKEGHKGRGHERSSWEMSYHGWREGTRDRARDKGNDGRENHSDRPQYRHSRQCSGRSFLPPSN